MSKSRLEDKPDKAPKKRKPKRPTKKPDIKSEEWQERYGDLGEYRKLCAIAYSLVNSKCCVCKIRPAREIHHAFYRKNNPDKPGYNLFPVCLPCHDTVCHHENNWNINDKDPVWRNRNNRKFTRLLRENFKFLAILAKT